jgi:ABC-type uncharacterized transport system permease subunit
MLHRLLNVFISSVGIITDIIDKTMGADLFRSTFHNSRIFEHTMLSLFCHSLLGLSAIL